MFKPTFNFVIDVDKGTITLKPTKKSVAIGIVSVVLTVVATIVACTIADEYTL